MQDANNKIILNLTKENPGMKYCGNGNHMVPFKDFYNDTSKKDGLQSRCKKCFKNKYRLNKFVKECRESNCRGARNVSH